MKRDFPRQLSMKTSNTLISTGAARQILFCGCLSGEIGINIFT
jgi:hypothetical protein